MLTKKQVKEQATTPKKALELTIKHWWENSRMKKPLNCYLPTSANLCGLCVLYDYPWDIGGKGCVKSGCKIRPTCCSKSSLYKKAERAYSYFQASKTQESWEKWIKAAKEMHKYLCSLRGKP